MYQKYEGYAKNPGMYDSDVSKRNPTLTEGGSLHSFGLDRWNKSDENRRVGYIGMADTKEAFDKLKTHLETHGPLPDEYFLCSDELSDGLSEFEKTLYIPDFSSGEEIYLDISLVCRNSDGKRYSQPFVTDKTLGEATDDCFRMFHTVTECSSMLNGRRFSCRRNNVDIALTGKEAAVVANSVELNLHGYLEPEVKALLSFALDEFTSVSCAAIQVITYHGRNDYVT